MTDFGVAFNTAVVELSKHRGYFDTGLMGGIKAGVKIIIGVIAGVLTLGGNIPVFNRGVVNTFFKPAQTKSSEKLGEISNELRTFNKKVNELMPESEDPDNENDENAEKGSGPSPNVI